MDKRTFLKTLALAGAAAPLSGSALAGWVGRFSGTPPKALAEDETFWAGVRNGYRLKPDYINLENGYYNILPEKVLEQYIGHIREVNLQGSYYMRTVQEDNKKAMAAKLAVIGGCKPAEVVITRNTTESLDLIISGYHWNSGDEAIMAEQDYGSMLRMFDQVSDRYGVVKKVLSVPNHPASDEEIVDLYASAITPRTRLIMISHMINITGQILPVRKVCDMAHAKGVEVMVDGAHTFAHVQFRIPDLGCDYFGTSLHKWLSVPLGAGLLYVREDRLSRVWPLLAEPDTSATGIYLLNHIGTHPAATDLTVKEAIENYTTLGPERKEARLRYLQQYWTSKARTIPGVIVNTPEDPARACGIANVGIQGISPGKLAEELLQQYKIYTVAIDGAGVHGCRITPNVFNTAEEMNALVAALRSMATA